MHKDILGVAFMQVLPLLMGENLEIKVVEDGEVVIDCLFRFLVSG